MSSPVPRTQSFPQFDVAYYQQTIEFFDRTMKSFADKLAQPDTTSAHRASLAYNIFKSDLHQLVARYSAGEQLAVMKAQLPRVVNELAAYVKEEKSEGVRLAMLDDYSQSLWLVSLALLLEADEPTWRMLLDANDDVGKDALFERLVALREPRRLPSTPPLLHPKPYSVLVSALDAKGEARSRLVKNYLDGWYKALKSVYWHDQHTIKGVGFFGYWSFETAAFVKTLHIPDTQFADNAYYPRDLAHG